MILKSSKSAAPATVIKPTPPPSLSTRQASLATQTAQNTVARARTLYVIKQWRSWADVTRDSGLNTASVSTLPFTQSTFDQFLADYVALAATRVAVAAATSTGVVSAGLTASATHHDVHVEAFTLRPQQRKSVDGIIEVFWEQKLGNAVLNPLRTGAGKSIIAGTIFKYIQDQKFFNRQFMMPQAKCVFLTKKAVVEKIIRTFKRMGLKNVGRNLFGNDICVTHYGALRAKANARLFVDFESVLFNNAVTLKRYQGEAPICVVLDECQEIKKWDSTRTQYVWGFFHNRTGASIKWLFTSATPGVTLNDMLSFTVFSGVKFAGETVTRETFPQFISNFKADPRKANAAAMERYRDYMGALIVSPPNDPSKVKATNKVTLLEFATQKERDAYSAAEAEYIAALERVGRGVSDRGLAMTQFMIYRAKCELMSTPYAANLARQAHSQGFAPVAAFSFQESVRDYVLDLIESGVPRDKISIIWGGDKAITEDEIFKPDEAGRVVNLKVAIDDVVAKVKDGRINNLACLLDDDWVKDNVRREPPDMSEGWDTDLAIEWLYEQLVRIPLIQQRYPSITVKKLLTRYRKWARYTYERVKRDESEEAARERRAKLAGVRIVAMSDDERQLEVDKFQDGRTEYCVYTLSAGGTGIDLDQQLPDVRPRHVFSTICYYAEEFMQALGRCMRVATLSDVTQEILFFKDTIAADHVAPRLMKKVASIAKIASSTDDLVSVLETSVIKKLTKEQLLLTSVVDESASEVDDSAEDDDDN